MTRLNFILFFALIFSALGLVNAQHKARKLYIELEQMAQAAKQYDQEYGQLQLEQSTWAMHSRVELIATQALQMRVPDSTRIQVVSSTDMKAVESLTAVPAKAAAVPAALVKPPTLKAEKPAGAQP
ncbi:MAG: cell division protein FtsL [Methylotenera sp.]|nr:cell division protein FtsL [Methylotenera sp.]